MNRYIEKRSFFLLLIMSTFVGLSCYTPSRDYPLVKSAALDFRDGFFVNTRSFLTFSDPMIEEVNGDKVSNPWPEYDIWELKSSLDKYAKITGEPQGEYLNSYVANQLGSKLFFDMELNRQTQGIEFEAGLVQRDFFENYNFDLCGSFAQRNKLLLSNVDIFCNFSTAFMTATSEGKYLPSESLLSKITNKYDPDQSRFAGVSREALIKDLDESRKKMQDEIGSDCYVAEQKGFCDLVVTLGLKKRFHHSLRCRRLDLYAGFIFTLPTGVTADPDRALSFNFGYPAPTLGMTGGMDILFKRDLSVGIGFLWNFGYENNELRRLPLGKEPAVFSPFKDYVSCSYGQTLTINPYILWKNVFMDRMDAKLSYISTKHHGDSLFCQQKCWEMPSPIVKSVLGASNKSNLEILRKHEMFTHWKTDFLELKFNYRAGNLVDAESNKTNIFLAYQKAWSLENALKQNRITLGISVNF